jgi:hemerythrin
MTKQFQWDDKYSVNVTTLDEQHKEFFDITNKILLLVENPGSPEPKEKLIRLLVKLGEYAFYHLDYEEDCLEKYNCPERENHAFIHDVYKEKITEYIRQARESETGILALAKQSAEFSQNWLSAHILSRDREYIPCLEGGDLE